MEVWWAGGMKILLINYEYPPFGGGAGNATQEIGRALTKMGYAVTALIVARVIFTPIQTEPV